MLFLSIISFLAFIYGVFALINLPIDEFVKAIYSPMKKKQSIKKTVELTKKPKEEKGIRKTISQTQGVLEIMNQTKMFDTVCIVSAGAGLTGIIVAIMMDNLFLVPILTIGFAIVPFWYLNFMYHSYNKQIDIELEGALNMINNSYLRNDNIHIIVAIEENIENIQPPILFVFKQFLNEVNFINSNTKQALYSMKRKLANPIFKEWIDALISCQDDKQLKWVLSDITSKLSDTRIVKDEVNKAIYKPLKDYLIVVFMMICILPAMSYIVPNLYSITFGKVILTGCLGTILFCTANVINISKPVEYRR